MVSLQEHGQLSGKMKKLRFIFWPNEEIGSVHVWNTYGGEVPAAVARITLYEITNDLPALRIEDAGDRMIGYHTERGSQTMAASYHAGPFGAYFDLVAGAPHYEFYRNWYTTTENMIKRLRFAGQNMYLMGHFMYDSTLYPTKKFTFTQNTYHSPGTAPAIISLSCCNVRRAITCP